MSPTDLDRVEKSVAEVEKRTRAEIIVVVNRQSGTYLDREILFAVLGGVLTLAAMILSERVFADSILLPYSGAVALIFFALARRLRPLRRALVRAGRRDHQVLVGARNAFCALNAGATRERTGLLVYVSRFEDRILVLPDYGLESKIEPGAWQRLLDGVGPPSRHPDLAEALEDFLAKAGELLARAFPPLVENPDEIPNRPRLEVV